jgi:CheY-like chemotaxis protein
MKNAPPPPVRILLVDDNVLGSSARQMILSDHGYIVETARSGEEAWDIFQREHFDIVVTDYKMPGMTGVDLIALIRTASTPARVILLSGRINEMGLTEKSSGADEVVSKSNKEVPEMLRAVKKLAVRPRRRGVASQKAVAKAKSASAK